LLAGILGLRQAGTEQQDKYKQLQWMNARNSARHTVPLCSGDRQLTYSFLIPPYLFIHSLLVSPLNHLFVGFLTHSLFNYLLIHIYFIQHLILFAYFIVIHSLNILHLQTFNHLGYLYKVVYFIYINVRVTLCLYFYLFP
jgi:hypothetical protein